MTNGVKDIIGHEFILCLFVVLVCCYFVVDCFV